jgi:hypothetical protein
MRHHGSGETSASERKGRRDRRPLSAKQLSQTTQPNNSAKQLSQTTQPNNSAKQLSQTTQPNNSAKQLSEPTISEQNQSFGWLAAGAANHPSRRFYTC